MMGAEIVKIRPARPSDATAIARVHEEAWRIAYQGIIPHLYLERMIARRGPAWWLRCIQHGGLLLLAFDDQAQGYASFGPARSARLPHAGEIFELYLAPPFQGVGLGKKLFLAARQELQRHNFRGLIVWALADNDMACDFYTRLGGRQAATASERYGQTVLEKVAFLWH